MNREDIIMALIVWVPIFIMAISQYNKAHKKDIKEIKNGRK